MLLMPETPKQVLDKVESLKGKKLVLYLIPLFVLFLLVGLAIGNLMPKILSNNENAQLPVDTEQTQKESTEYRGKIVYVDPNYYPNDDIEFYLEDDLGKEVILLKSNDEKLTVVEGLNVIVFGRLEKTANGEQDVLNVEKVVVKN